MKFQGQVKFVGAVETPSEKLRKQTIVVEETTGEFPQSLAVDFLNDRIDALEDVKVGDIVEVSVNFRSNTSKSDETKHFNSVNGWKLETIAVAKQ